MNMKIELENCQKSLTLKDFEEVESKLGHVLPERLKEFYLQYNGCLLYTSDAADD